METLSGLVERITYHSEENGFCVLRIKAKGHKELVTLVGNLAAISVGEHISASGFWVNNREHGLQFKANSLDVHRPHTLEGIEKYLGSGLIKGIGPYYAKRLVEAFGDEVFTIIEDEPGRLIEAEGIGQVRAKKITKDWIEQRKVREIMVFLQSHGVGTSRATKIYKTYGDQAIEIVKENPYKLARDIRGIGFISADLIAQNLGIASDSSIRARAGVNHTLIEATTDGNCGLLFETLEESAAKLLDLDSTIIKKAIQAELAAGDLITDTINNEKAIFLAAFYNYEKNIASKIKILNSGSKPWKDIEVVKALPWIEEKLKINLADKQKEAIKTALKNKVTVITGGPGTGKTTLVKSILTILKAKEVKIKLCAPTGRAAKRLSETTSQEAVTIHRLLDFNPSFYGFNFNEEKPLDCDLVVVDESSMIDVSLMQSLLKAIPNRAALIIVGDVDQLPSVGAGQVLKDIINSDSVPIIKLTEIFRQAAKSKIISNAHLINQGKVPNLSLEKDSNISDFYFIEAEPADDLIEKVKKVVKDRIPKRFKLDPIKDIQVLCPMQRGAMGVRAFNVELQTRLNSNTEFIEKYGQKYSVGDKVMQTSNNYDKEVYNGDIGFISKVNIEDQELTALFDEREVTYEFSDLDQLTIAYATTIHKSQGSEFPAVVMPLCMKHYIMLKRNLIYTGITRAKKLLVIIGQKKALGMAVRDNTSMQRLSKLREWLLS